MSRAEKQAKISTGDECYIVVESTPEFRATVFTIGAKVLPKCGETRLDFIEEISSKGFMALCSMAMRYKASYGEQKRVKRSYVAKTLKNLLRRQKSRDRLIDVRQRLNEERLARFDRSIEGKHSEPGPEKVTILEDVIEKVSARLRPGSRNMLSYMRMEYTPEEIAIAKGLGPEKIHAIEQAVSRIRKVIGDEIERYRKKRRE